MSGGGAATEKPIIVDFNTKLATAVAGFKANHTGVKTWLYDSHAAFTKVLDSPSTVSKPSLGGTLTFVAAG